MAVHRFPPRLAQWTCVALTLLCVAQAADAHAGVRARAAATCDVSKDGRKLGPTYVTSLKTTGVSCAKAKKLVTAYNSCRRSHGGADGKCTSKVRGFSCKEQRNDVIATQFSAKVSCKHASRRVKFGYTQYT